MVRRLQSAGYKTGVLTNGHADVQRAKTAACGAGSLFGEERVIIAGAGGAADAPRAGGLEHAAQEAAVREADVNLAHRPGCSRTQGQCWSS